MERLNRLEQSLTLTNLKQIHQVSNETSIDSNTDNNNNRLLKKSHTNKYEGPLGQHNNCLDNRVKRTSIFEIKTIHHKINKISGDNCQLIDEDSPRG